MDGDKFTLYDVKLTSKKTIKAPLGLHAGNSLAMTHVVRSVIPKDVTTERFGFIALNAAMEVIGVHVVYVGWVNGTVTPPREIAQRALLNNAKGVVLFHNHMTENEVKPSEDDKKTTTEIRNALKLFNIGVVDHIILGRNKAFSFAEDGLLYE